MENQTIVNQYAMTRQIGEGGMAQVWEAQHLHLDTRVAIKFLLPRFAGDPELEERFLDEARRHAQLQHPNIVPVTDFFPVDGHSYMVMQYIEGRNLEERIRDQHGPLPVDEIHAISWDVLSALSYAHSKGLIHRDVKPSNILIEEQSGRAFLMDFGIAKAMDEERSKTRTGTVIGTALYMSPDQILTPKLVDARSDIYSFGCVLYAMLTGVAPFDSEGATEFSIKDCHVRNAPPPLSHRNPSISPAVAEVVLKCMEKSPENRYQNCHEVMIALDAAIASTATPPVQTASAAGGSIPPVPPGPFPPPPGPPPSFVPPVHPATTFEPARPSKNRSVLIGGLVVLALAVVWVAYRYWPTTPIGQGTETAQKTGIVTPAEMALRLEGSTTLGDELIPAMLKAFLAKEGAKDIEPQKGSGNEKDHLTIFATLPGKPRQSFSIIANGSGKAFTALAAGTADIGMASRQIKNGAKPPDNEVEKLSKLGDMLSFACEHIVGLDGISVVVNSGNPIDSLDKSQVADIFRGRITDWAQIPHGRTGPIHLYSRNKDSGTFDFFVGAILNGDKNAISPDAQIKDNGDDIANAVGADPNGIGYVGLGQVASAKTLSLSDGLGTAPLGPTPFTVATEDYLLSRRLYLYIPANAPELARSFATFAEGPLGQRIVTEYKFIEQTGQFEKVPIPESAPPAYRKAALGKLRLNITFRFRPNGTDLDNKALADIHRAINALQQHGVHQGINLLGFADSQGGNGKANCDLSKQRAQVVEGAFKSSGVGFDQVLGLCTAMPVGDNLTEPGRQKNRRVEVWVP